MSEGTKLCVSSIEPKDLPEAVFSGRLPRDDLRVVIAPGAHQAMRTHAKSSLEAEVCGVMLGALKRDAQGPFLLIEDVIEGAATQSEAARVTFTPQSWEHIFKEQERRAPELRMVGWYHTHPRFGIFLSSYDRFIHRNFFGVEPWMVAYVVDPVRDEEGLFYWRDGDVERLPRYWVGAQPRLSDGAEFEGRRLEDDRDASKPQPAKPAAMAAAAAAPAGQRARGPEPADDDLPLLPLPSPSVLILAFMLLWLVSTALGGLFGDPQARRMADLQRDLLLIQSDLALELRDIRVAAGLPPSRRPFVNQAAQIAASTSLTRGGALGGTIRVPARGGPADGTVPVTPAPESPAGPAGPAGPVRAGGASGDGR